MLKGIKPIEYNIMQNAIRVDDVKQLDINDLKIKIKLPQANVRQILAHINTINEEKGVSNGTETNIRSSND